MDPNETIARLRELLGGDHSGHVETPRHTGIEHASKPHKSVHDLHGMVCDAEELFQALDRWLRSGGLLPVRWKGGNLQVSFDPQGTCRRCGAGGQS